jgi:hypothetical protein
MRLAQTPIAVLRFQYRLARFPLQLIDERVLARFGDEAPARLFFERLVGTLDATAGRLLGHADLQQRGAALVERSDALSRASQFDADAAAWPPQADQKLKSTPESVVSDIKGARDAAERETVEARVNAQQRKAGR